MHRQGGPVPDDIMLSLLKGSLDRTSQNRLVTRQEAKPGLTYAEFWGELQGVFGADVPERNRQEWERVTVRGKRLDPDVWRDFQAEFEMTLRRVEDARDREVRERIMAEIPSEWRMELLTEGVRRAEEQFWVRIPEPFPMAVTELEDFLAQMVPNTRGVVLQGQRCVMVNCGSREGREALKVMNGWTMNGVVMRVEDHVHQMTRAEIFQWVDSRLRVMEQMEGYGRWGRSEGRAMVVVKEALSWL